MLDGVLETADRVLNLAGGLLHFAFGLELAVAGHFARDFLDFAFGLLDRAFDAILVHFVRPLVTGVEGSVGQRMSIYEGSAAAHVRPIAAIRLRAQGNGKTAGKGP